MSEDQLPQPEIDRRETRPAFEEIGPAPLAGTWYELLPVMPEHEGFLFGLATDPTTGWRWRFRGSMPSIESFRSQLWNGILAQFVVADKRTAELVGHVIAYNADFHAGFAYMGIVASEAASGRGAVLEAGSVFINYLFHTFNFYKLYFEVPEFNLPQFGGGLGRIAKEEGRLRGHSFYGGYHWDEIIFALYRDDAMQLASTRHVQRVARAQFGRPGSTEELPNGPAQ